MIRIKRTTKDSSKSRTIPDFEQYLVESFKALNESDEDDVVAGLDMYAPDDVDPCIDIDSITDQATRDRIQKIIDEDADKPLVQARLIKLVNPLPQQDPAKYFVISMRRLNNYLRVTDSYLNVYFPVFSKIYRSLVINFTLEIPTMATDDIRIFINPAFLVYMYRKEGRIGPLTIIIHEIFHVLMKHQYRRQKRIWDFPDMLKCNIAMDHEINLIISHLTNKLDFGGVFKRVGGCIDSKYEGMLWEDIYLEHGNELTSPPQNNSNQQQGPSNKQQQGQNGQQQQNQQQQDQQNQQGQQGQSGPQDQQNQQGQPQQNQSGQQGQGQQGQGNGQSGGQGQGGGEGQSGQGQPEQQGQGQPGQGNGQSGGYEQGNGQGSGSDINDALNSDKGARKTQSQSNMDVRDVKDSDWGDEAAKNAGYGEMSKTLKDSIKRENQKSIAQKMREGGIPIAGTGMGNIIDRIDASLEPVVDWKDILEDLLKGLFDEESQRWDKKWIGDEIFKRVKRNWGGESGQTLVLAVDTSGSVDQNMLTRFASEICEVVESVPKIKQIIILPFDDGVQEEIVLRGAEELRDFADNKSFEVTGRGGTDFQSVFDYCENQLEDEKINALIIYTDGGDSFIKYPPDNVTDEDNSVIWAITGSDFERWEKNCPMGHVIDLNDL